MIRNTLLVALLCSASAFAAQSPTPEQTKQAQEIPPQVRQYLFITGVIGSTLHKTGVTQTKAKSVCDAMLKPLATTQNFGKDKDKVFSAAENICVNIAMGRDPRGSAK